MRHEHRHTTTERAGRRWKARAAAMVMGLALLSAACGGSSGTSEPKVATLGDTAGAEAAGDGAHEESSGGEKDPEKAALAFARCMRQNGVDVPDPQTGGNGMVLMKPGDGPTPSDEKMREAAEKCDHLMKEAGPAQLSPEDQSRLQDAMVSFARCMRDNGVDVPDPEVGEGGGFRMRVGDPRADPESPPFREAERKCQPLMADAEKKAGLTTAREGPR